MGELHVSDGRISGSAKGAKIVGILVLIFMNIYYFIAGYCPVWAKIVHLILSFGNIPIAVLGQKIGSAIHDAVHGAGGEDTESVYVSRSFKDILSRKYLGATCGFLLYEGILFLIFKPGSPY